MRKTKRNILTALAAALATVAIAIGLAGCGSSTSSDSSDSNTITVMLDWTPNTNHVGLYDAQKLGYYKAEGINVKILPTSSAGAESAVQMGVANVGFTTISNVVAVDEKGSDLWFIWDLTQKPVAQWCALAPNKSITSPKDFDGKTFVTFGSAEQTAVLKQMIKHAGGTGNFKSVTVGTSTFQALESGKGDFGGFYETWEGVESDLKGPKLRCFNASDYGVPGNPDQLGYAVNRTWATKHVVLLQKFIDATARGYAYALANPDAAAQILVDGAKNTKIDPALAKASMQKIVSNNLWGNSQQIAAAWNATKSDKTVPSSEFAGLGRINMSAGQKYVTFLWQSGVYKKDQEERKDSSSAKSTDNSAMASDPTVSDMATNLFVYDQAASTLNANSTSSAD